ncbi:B12-binding domain-containing radical SAM protein [Roseateles sp. MS654]|uniref:B12-binding domain-containing radical SAM protein n=1 Tax=Roseateles sp. MS654 TaxID=3412685 RepID=UPI003C2E89F5
MLSILIGHSYFLRFDPKQFERAKPYPPLATLQVAAQVRAAGHEVALFDAMLAEGTADFEALLRAHAPQAVVLYEDNYNYLSKMCLGRMRVAACEMVAAARRRGARVIVAGSDPSDDPDPYLDAGAEVVLIGEGLDALHALLARLDGEPNAAVPALCDDLSGIVFRIGGRTVRRTGDPGTTSATNRTTAVGPAPAWPAINGRPVVWLGGDQAPRTTSSSPSNEPTTEPTPEPSRTPIHDVAWDLVDVGRYRAVWQRAHGRFSLNMAGSKGCSFRCAWCAKPIWGNRYQPRAPEAVAAEMLWLKRHLAPDHVWFADDIFGFRAEWVRRFADALAGEGGGLPFTIQTRADLITEAMADALRDAGCHEAWIGAESGSQRVLDAMHKGTTVEELHVARRRLGERGIRVGFFIQLGYLGEELEDLHATRALIETARPDDIGVSVSYPLPGTPFHEQVKAQLGAKTHWEDSGDLAMMFQGRYTTEFYRAFRNLLHRQVALAQGGEPVIGATGGLESLRHARSRLRRQWSVLLGRERRYRTSASAEVPQEPAQVRGGVARVAAAT